MHTLIGASAAPGFDDPLEMLEACHGRIQAQCRTLQKLLAHLQNNGHDTQASQAARAILRYFDTAGRYHHQDEEQDLFPLLLATRDLTATALVERLLGEHQKMDAAWQDLRTLLIDIAEDGADKLEAEIAARFCDLYARHISMENSELLPLAKALLHPSQLQALGRSMAARRGVTF